MDTLTHRPVLLDKVAELLRPATGRWYLDGTVGAGGHAERILALSQPDGQLIGIDRDREALDAAARSLERFGDRVHLVHANFSDAPSVLAGLHVKMVHGLVLDLGLSSLQLDAPLRGFSFRHPDAPLDLRADPSAGHTAAQKLARVSERELADILWRFADERRSRAIARALCRERQRRQLQTVGQLVAVVQRVVRRPTGRIHPATRTLMALRIWVNDELANLERALDALPDLIEPLGRAVLISFHSKEDRLVKLAFRQQAEAGLWTVLTRRPIRPTEDEIRSNPRARSARLRAVERKGVSLADV